MSAQRLRHVVTIQAQSATPNDLGEIVGGWVDHLTRIRADVVQVGGREALAGGVNLATQPIRVYVRYRTGITEQMRLVWNGRNYDIKSIVDVGGMRRTLELVCETGST